MSTAAVSAASTSMRRQLLLRGATGRLSALHSTSMQSLAAPSLPPSLLLFRHRQAGRTSSILLSSSFSSRPPPPPGLRDLYNQPQPHHEQQQQQLQGQQQSYPPIGDGGDYHDQHYYHHHRQQEPRHAFSSITQHWLFPLVHLDNWGLIRKVLMAIAVMYAAEATLFNPADDDDDDEYIDSGNNKRSSSRKHQSDDDIQSTLRTVSHGAARVNAFLRRCALSGVVIACRLELLLPLVAVWLTIRYGDVQVMRQALPTATSQVVLEAVRQVATESQEGGSASASDDSLIKTMTEAQYRKQHRPRAAGDDTSPYIVGNSSSKTTTFMIGSGTSIKEQQQKLRRDEKKKQRKRIVRVRETESFVIADVTDTNLSPWEQKRQQLKREQAIKQRRQNSDSENALIAIKAIGGDGKALDWTLKSSSSSTTTSSSSTTTTTSSAYRRRWKSQKDGVDGAGDVSVVAGNSGLTSVSMVKFTPMYTQQGLTLPSFDMSSLMPTPPSMLATWAGGVEAVDVSCTAYSGDDPGYDDGVDNCIVVDVMIENRSRPDAAGRSMLTLEPVSLRVVEVVMTGRESGRTIVLTPALIPEAKNHATWSATSQVGGRKW